MTTVQRASTTKNYNKSNRKYSAATKSYNNSNRKCGEITFCTQMDKRVYTLNCLYCPQICLQLDIFINHMEQEHDEDLMQSLYVDNDEKELGMYDDNDMQDDTSEDLHDNEATTFGKEPDESINCSINDPLEEDDISTSALSFECSIKKENMDYDDTANQTIVDPDDGNGFTINKDQKFLHQNPNFSMTNNQEIQYTNDDINNLRNEIKEDIRYTKIKLTNEIKEQTKNIKIVLLRVLEELKLSKDVKTTPKTNIIPKEPFSSIDDFLNFEANIQNDEEKYYQLVCDFEQQTATTFPNYVKSIWRKLIKDGAAMHMCWKGTDRKTPVRSLTITKALKAACLSKFNVEADLNFEKISIQHFQHAKGRHLKKLNYKNKPKTELKLDNELPNLKTD